MGDKIYFDTCIISGFVKQDMKSTDMNAFEKIIMVSDENKSFYSSTMALEELNKIPSSYRQGHTNYYKTLEIVNGSTFDWIDENTTNISSNDKDPIYLQLRDGLPDENDARHIYLAYKNGFSHFLTIDERTILSRKDKIHDICGLIINNPSEYLDESNT